MASRRFNTRTRSFIYHPIMSSYRYSDHYFRIFIKMHNVKCENNAASVCSCYIQVNLTVCLSIILLTYHSMGEKKCIVNVHYDGNYLDLLHWWCGCYLICPLDEKFLLCPLIHSPIYSTNCDMGVGCPWIGTMVSTSSFKRFRFS